MDFEVGVGALGGQSEPLPLPRLLCSSCELEAWGSEGSATEAATGSPSPATPF